MKWEACIAYGKRVSTSLEHFDLIEGLTGSFLYWRTANVIGFLVGVTSYLATVNQNLIDMFLHFRPNPTLMVAFVVTQGWSFLWHAVAISIHRKVRLQLAVEYALRGFVWLCMLGFGSILLSVFQMESDAITLALTMWIAAAYVFLEGFVYTVPALFGSKVRFVRWLKKVETGLRGGAYAIKTLHDIQDEASKGFEGLGGEETESDRQSDTK